MYGLGRDIRFSIGYKGYVNFLLKCTITLKCKEEIKICSHQIDGLKKARKNKSTNFNKINFLKKLKNNIYNNDKCHATVVKTESLTRLHYSIKVSEK